MNRRLRVVPGMTAAALRDEASLELDTLEDEARAHVRRMRLALQLRFFDEEPFTTVRRSLLSELDRYERKFETGEAA